MSALWTPGRAGVSPGFLRHGPAPPSQVLPTVPCPPSAQGPGGHGSTPGPPRVGPSRLAPRGSGSTGQGLCVLHEGPTYPKCTPPSPSSTPPSYSAPRRRRQPPHRPSLPPPAGRSNSSPIRQTHPTDVLRGHDIRNSQKPRDNTVGRRRRRPVPSKPLPLRCPPCLPALPLPTRSLPRRRHRPCHSPIRLSPRRRASSPGTTPTPATCRGAAPEQRRGRSSSRRS